MLDGGRAAAAAVLAASALEALGLGEGRARALRGSVAAGVVPSVESVEEALRLVEERLGASGAAGGAGGSDAGALLGLGAAGLAAALILGGPAGAALAALAASSLLAGIDLAVHRAQGARGCTVAGGSLLLGGLIAAGPNSSGQWPHIQYFWALVYWARSMA